MWWRSCLIVAALMLPFGYFVYQGVQGGLTDPVQYLMIRLGHTALIILLLVLSVPLLKPVTPWLLKHRRALGLMAFFYGVVHFASYFVLAAGADLRQLWEDVAGKPFILVGAASLMILLALAVTSNQLSIRKLKKRWKKLHLGLYPALFLVIVHGLWAARSDYGLWLLYGVVFTVLVAAKRLPAGTVPIFRRSN